MKKSQTIDEVCGVKPGAPGSFAAYLREKAAFEKKRELNHRQRVAEARKKRNAN